MQKKISFLKEPAMSFTIYIFLKAISKYLVYYITNPLFKSRLRFLFRCLDWLNCREKSKHLMLVPKGNDEFFPRDHQCSPRGTLRSMGNKTRYIYHGESHQVFCYTSQLNNRKKKCVKIVCLTPTGTQICHCFKEYDLITCESKDQVVVSQGSQ